MPPDCGNFTTAENSRTTAQDLFTPDFVQRATWVPELFSCRIEPLLGPTASPFGTVHLSGLKCRPDVTWTGSSEDEEVEVEQ